MIAVLNTKEAVQLFLLNQERSDNNSSSQQTNAEIATLEPQTEATLKSQHIPPKFAGIFEAQVILWPLSESLQEFFSSEGTAGCLYVLPSFVLFVASDSLKKSCKIEYPSLAMHAVMSSSNNISNSNSHENENENEDEDENDRRSGRGKRNLYCQLDPQGFVNEKGEAVNLCDEDKEMLEMKFECIKDENEGDAEDQMIVDKLFAIISEYSAMNPSSEEVMNEEDEMITEEM